MKRIIVAFLCFFTSLVIALPATANDRYRDYRGHHGYRERPYDRHRHYDHFNYKKHMYDYRGHWRSWNDWDRYARKHPYLYRHGHYYHDGAHLLYRYCEPGARTCVFFSIGR